MFYVTLRSWAQKGTLLERNVIKHDVSSQKSFEGH
jgi:hypothetical protein